MTGLRVHWVECQRGWCSFETVILDNVTDQGVYVIWYKGNPGRVVRLGRGNIADRLRTHRQDDNILAYRHHGLLVTWAQVEVRYQNGVEKYLADRYPPLVGERFPDVRPVEVNPPWP